MAALTSITPNEQYTKYVHRWTRVRDIDNGEARLKERDLSLLTYYDPKDYDKFPVNYLRLINPSDRSPYNLNRNAMYIKGARLYNATSRTASGLFGMAFRIEPEEPELPSRIEYILENVDSSGTSMQQQARSVVFDEILIGRDGLLVDMPPSRGVPTAGDVNRGLRANIQEYKAESIIDWHESVINGIKTLDLVVLREEVEKFTDAMMINTQCVTQYRVFRLRPDGVTAQIYTEGENELIASDEIAVMQADGRQFQEIPFVFVGSKNNKPSIDNLPMEDIANVNIGHYQENANIASSSFQVSACQPWIADDRYQQVTRNENGDTQPLGEETLIVLGTGGKFNLTAPPENTLGSKLMQDYEDQMVALGAQLITNSAGNETAEAARIKHASDVSVLDVIASNVSDAYSKCIEWVCLFMGVEYDNYRYELNRNFFETKLTAQEIDALVRTWQSGAISKKVLDGNLVKARIIPQEEDLEKMNDSIDEEAGMPNLDQDPVDGEVTEEVNDGDDITGTN